MKQVILTLTLILGMSTMANAQGKQMDVRYVVIHKAGKNWNPDLDMFQQPYIKTNPEPSKADETHIAFYGKLFSEGKTSLGGPMLDSSDAKTGRVEVGKQVGMMISAPNLTISKEDWEKIAAEDPAVKAGILSFEVREWLVAMKQE